MIFSVCVKAVPSLKLVRVLPRENTVHFEQPFRRPPDIEIRLRLLTLVEKSKALLSSRCKVLKIHSKTLLLLS